MHLNKTLIFDFDGTLADSMVPWADGLMALLERENVSYPEDIVEILTPLGDEGMARYLMGIGMQGSVEEILAKLDSFAYVLYEKSIPAKATAIETLKLLKARGHSLNILSSASHKMLDAALKRLGMTELFENIWSTDDFALKKSQREIYLKTSEELGVSLSEITFFDDNITAITAARSAGITVVGVYDPTGAVFEKQIREIADKYVYRLAEILK